jgi:2-polyprenyl-6-methoxyphenol hydroxylase-like FAD-dependent oxidoreductase
VANGQVKVLHQYDFRQLAAHYGPAYLLQRSTLIALLREGIGDLPMRFATTVVALEAADGEVRATVSDGTMGVYDVVVGADGIHSGVRRLIFGEVPLQYQT